MHIPRFILAAFITLVLGGTIVATTLLVSSSEPRLGETIVVTPHGTPPPAPTPSPTQKPTPTPSPTAAPSPTPSSSAPPSDGAEVVPGCAPLAVGDDCDDVYDWDDPDDD